MSQSIVIEQYSDKSFVVLGETRVIKDQLKALGGLWNTHLRNNQKGWIFSNNKREAVEQIIKNSGNDEDIPPLEPLVDFEPHIPIMDYQPSNKRKINTDQSTNKKVKLDTLRFTLQTSQWQCHASIDMINDAYHNMLNKFQEYTGKSLSDVYRVRTEIDDQFQFYYDWMKAIKSSGSIDQAISKINIDLRANTNEESHQRIIKEVIQPSIQDCFDETKCRKEAEKYVKPEFIRLIQLRNINDGYIYQSLRQRKKDIKEDLASIHHRLYNDFTYMPERQEANERYKKQIQHLCEELQAINNYWESKKKKNDK